ncbi:hypothetical protein Hanom_Chr03g00206021 [Helianthus anomalus]
MEDFFSFTDKSSFVYVSGVKVFGGASCKYRALLISSISCNNLELPKSSMLILEDSTLGIIIIFTKIQNHWQKKKRN